MTKETRLAYAKIYAEADEKDKLRDPYKNWAVYYEEFKEELNPTKKIMEKKDGK
jgi:hypothetical protein